jgi:Diacylglycerol kinase catalytic domain
MAGSGVGGDQGMVTTEQQAPGRATVAQRWLARLALVAAAAAVLVPLAAIGFRASVALVLVGVVGLGLTAAGVWWALTNKGLVRWLAIALAVLAPLVVLILYTSRRLLWVVLVALGLLAVAVAAGRAALGREVVPEKMREHDAPPPRRPYLIMNPRSGGGKVTRFGLKDKAEALGATVALLEGPGTVDVGELARTAVANGADLLGVAGGDGTQALVAGIAAEHDIPLLVISAGTRNHFALDLGLDREDPSRCLEALTDGVELRVDLGSSPAARSSTTPPSGPMPPWCRARPTAMTSAARRPRCSPICSSARAGRGWWPRQGM